MTKNEEINYLGPTIHRKEYKGANLFKNTRTSTKRDHEEHKGANLFINTKFQQQGSTRDQYI